MNPSGAGAGGAGSGFWAGHALLAQAATRRISHGVKLEAFEPADKGQMEFYLRWLDRHERQPGEEAPIGLILCAGQRRETVELLDLEKSGIRVSSYWTDLMPKGQLQKKLHQAVRLARARMAEQAKIPSNAR